MAVLFVSLILVIITITVINCQLTANFAGLSSIRFACKIYQELSKESSDVLVSPSSLQSVLGLLQLGADGATETELSQALSLPLHREQLLTNLTSIAETLQSSSFVQVVLASAIFTRRDVQVAEAFQASSAILGASVRSLLPDFDAAVVDVNNWVRSSTRGLLDNVLRPGDINQDTALLLVNALYFKGRWRDADFLEKDTESAKFYRRTGPVPVNMMRCSGYFNIGRDQQLNATYLELAYVGDEFVLNVVLPDDVDGLTRLIVNIERVLSSPPPLHEEQVDLRLPRFRASSEVRLKSVLHRLGVQHAFANAQLARLTADGKPLAVSDVVHNTLLDVNEKGTEAAAASAVGIVDRIFSQPIPFFADHPFLYLLQHKSSGIILFIGHYSGD